MRNFLILNRSRKGVPIEESGDTETGKELNCKNPCERDSSCIASSGRDRPPQTRTRVLLVDIDVIVHSVKITLIRAALEVFDVHSAP